MEIIQTMSAGDLMKWVAGIIAAASVFIEITPIKINPISAVFRWIGKRINKEVMDKMDVFEKKVEALEKSDAIDCRVRILTFADEIRRGVKHSQETFDQTLSDIDVYERYCAEHPDFLNNRTIAAKAKILETYSKCMDDNDFL